MGQTLRLAIVTPRFSEAGTVGGAETLLANWAARLAAAGHSVTLLTTCARNHHTWENEIPAGARRIRDIEVHFFPTAVKDLGRRLQLEALMNRGRILTDEEEMEWLAHSVHSPELYTFLRDQQNRFDAILVGPYLFGVCYQAALIVPHKTLLIPCLHDEPFARLRLMRTLFQSVGGVLFNSEPERKLAERLFEIPSERARIVGMGIEPFEVNASAFAERTGLNAPYVVYSGRREEGKGIPMLCEYMAAFRSRTGKDIKLVFTGSGDISAPSELWPHIVDLGFVSEQEKHEAMAGAVAFVHPSTLESLGIVLLEAWMARTPALVRADSPVLQWQCERSQGGLWFRNYVEFEIELILLLERPELRHCLGARGREYVLREYSWPAVEQRFFEALKTVLR